ncbi:hypothetical protein VIGAN_02086100 [Vigna angularis var. angularis]|uniref:Uncharacterized protein n=1 Tax=Vigna angularis var. angularis TaxID=157739 RepID=A0A0S3RC47_PHAAN|nr:hypothetical protein VIGAN_02086100 [Vigna angularis var. angularis]
MPLSTPPNLEPCLSSSKRYLTVKQNIFYKDNSWIHNTLLNLKQLEMCIMLVFHYDAHNTINQSNAIVYKRSTVMARCFTELCRTNPHLR